MSQQLQIPVHFSSTLPVIICLIFHLAKGIMLIKKDDISHVFMFDYTAQLGGWMILKCHACACMYNIH